MHVHMLVPVYRRQRPQKKNQRSLGNTDMSGLISSCPYVVCTYRGIDIWAPPRAQYRCSDRDLCTHHVQNNDQQLKTPEEKIGCMFSPCNWRLHVRTRNVYYISKIYLVLSQTRMQNKPTFLNHHHNHHHPHHHHHLPSTHIIILPSSAIFVMYLHISDVFKRYVNMSCTSLMEDKTSICMFICPFARSFVY